MSRETDSSSAGPQGRGGAAYPSGTPPYGSRQYPSLHPTQDAPEEPAAVDEPHSDEPRTETTLTTRIRINIPGSRPIPPVVMRTPMSGLDAAAASAAKSGAVRDGERTGSAPRPDAARNAPAAEPQAEEKTPTSDWFAPRKSSGTNGAGMSVPGAQAPSPAAGPGSSGPETSVPGPSRPGSSGQGHGHRQGQVPGPAGPSAGPSTNGGAPGAGLPYFSGNPGQGGPGAPRTSGSLSDLAATGGGAPSGAPGGPGTNGFAPGAGAPGIGAPGAQPPGGPVGPTAGPVKGSMPVRPRTGGQGVPQGPGPGAPGHGPTPGPGAPGPGQDPGMQGPGSGGPRMSDDTAVLTPQQPPGPVSDPTAGHVSGDTLTSGIPVVPAERRSPFPPIGGPAVGSGTGQNPLAPPHIGGLGPQGGGEFSAPEFPAGPGAGSVGPVVPTPAPAEPRPAPVPRPAPAKKGRSKLVLVGAGVVGLLGVAYGAGLLMNHSEVPKSTTVLGVDIGGGTKEDAVSKLDTAIGERAFTPLQLTVGGKKEQLAPDKAGLSLDSQATVRNAAGSDYNPVSVISSLFGGERVAEPVILVDEEKLSVALTDLAGVSGSATEGTITFEPGKAVAVPGKSGKALDVARSMLSVKDAYRAQVETGRPNIVELPLATRGPSISQAELDRAMKEFAEPAMSGLVTIKAGAKQIKFGPARSLPKILSMKAIDGKLVEVYNKKAIDELLEGVFDGVMITKGDGKKHQVSADDVAQAMGPALRGATPQERTGTIELNPS